MSALSTQKIGSLDAQRLGDPVEVVDGDRVQPALDLGDVSAVQVGPMRQFFLTDRALGPEPPDIAGDDISNRAGPVALHERDHTVLTRL